MVATIPPEPAPMTSTSHSTVSCGSPTSGSSPSQSVASVAPLEDSCGSTAFAASDPLAGAQDPRSPRVAAPAVVASAPCRKLRRVSSFPMMFLLALRLFSAAAAICFGAAPCVLTIAPASLAVIHARLRRGDDLAHPRRSSVALPLFRPGERRKGSLRSRHCRLRGARYALEWSRGRRGSCGIMQRKWARRAFGRAIRPRSREVGLF